jgi:integrase
MFQRVIKETSVSLGMDPVLPYTFRKCYSNWLMESGIPQWRVEMYMGHSPRSMTLRYQRTDVWGWLKEDGEKLRKWIDEERTKRGLKPS